MRYTFLSFFPPSSFILHPCSCFHLAAHVFTVFFGFVRLEQFKEGVRRIGDEAEFPSLAPGVSGAGEPQCVDVRFADFNALEAQRLSFIVFGNVS